MRKQVLTLFAVATFAITGVAAITTGYTYRTVFVGGQIAQGAAVTNTVDTAKAVGVATFVVPYKLANGGRLDIEFAGAYTNGAAFVACPTNNAALLASYTVTNGSLLKVSYPAAHVPGRFMRVVIKSVAGANSASAVWSGVTSE